jgi:hypothetical protein
LAPRTFHEECWRISRCDRSHGYEVRASYEGDDRMFRTQCAADAQTARAVAAPWRETLLADPSFTEIGKEP